MGVRHYSDRRSARRFVPVPLRALIASASVIALLSGCRGGLIGWVGFGGSSYELRSVARQTVLRPSLRLRAYRAEDANTAHFFLTDLSVDDLQRDADLAGITGNIVHIHLFLRPKAGRTPIDSTAFNASIEHLVIANGQIGIYQGGGFMIPGGTPGDRTLGGNLSGATLRLTRATPGLRDLLGPSQADARFSAKLDEETASLIERRLRQLARAATPIED